LTTHLNQFAGARLCLLNWRDREHPEAGGAELYCEEVASRFAAAGADVTLFTARYPGSLPVEERDGFRIIRRGGTFGVYASAAAHLLRNRRKYDGVLDFQNGIPFFAPLFAPGLPTVMVIHHVHQDQFRHRFPPAVSSVGRYLEGPMSKRVYQHRPIVAVSPSTRRDVRLRLGLDGPIHVVPNGLDRVDAVRRRSERPRIAIVTRLACHKRLPLLVEAVARLRGRWPELEVHIGGTGPAHDEIAGAVRELGLRDRVHLHGWVSDEERDRLLASAWLTVLPSEGEGWGLTVLEANSVGVPAVTLEVAGLRDSVIPGHTGWLAPDVETLPETIDAALSELADPTRAAGWERRTRSWADSFSWDRTAEDLARVLSAERSRVQHAPVVERRVRRDLSVVGAFVPDGDPRAAAAELRSRLRTMDRVMMDVDGITLVLHGADEFQTEELVRSLDVRGELRVRLMRPHERLRGTGDPKLVA
jgi:glycosyltransferase involved in cell wall biosynthesis